MATNKLTLNKLQFLGIITREYLDQMHPVIARESDCETLSLSAGRVKSPIPAITRPCLTKKNIIIGLKYFIYVIKMIHTHLNTGAQKKTVFGPEK